MATWNVGEWNAKVGPSYTGPKLRFWNNDQTYSGQSTCPWAARVFLALLEKQLPFEESIVPLANKPQEFKDLYAAEHPDPTERAKVPILEVGYDTEAGFNLVESDVVSEFIARRFHDRGTPLLPDCPRENAHMQMFVKSFMKYIAPTTFTLLGSKSPAAIRNEFGKLATGISVLENCLKKSQSNGPFFCKSFALSEVLCASFIIRLYIQLPHFRNIDLERLCDHMKCSRMKAWIIAVCNHPNVILSTPTEQSLTKNLPPYVKVNYFDWRMPWEEQIDAISGLHLQSDEASFANLVQEGTKLLEEDRAKRREGRSNNTNSQAKL